MVPKSASEWREWRQRTGERVRGRRDAARSQSTADRRTGFSDGRPLKEERDPRKFLPVVLTFLLLGVMTASWPEVAEVFDWPLSTSSIHQWLINTLPFLGGATPFADLFLRSLPISIFVLITFLREPEETKGLMIAALAFGTLFLAPAIAAGISIAARLASQGVHWLIRGTVHAASATGHGFSATWLWAADHVGLLIGIGAALVVMAVVFLGWFLSPAEPRERRPDVLTEFFQFLGGLAAVFALPAYGAYLFEQQRKNGGPGFETGFAWCWGWYWWDRTTSDPVWNVVVVIFGTIFSLIATLLYIVWGIVSFLFWVVLMLLVLLCLAWWELANKSPTGAAIAFLVGVVAVAIAHHSLKSLFGANPLFVMLSRARVKFGHIVDASILAFFRDGATQRAPSTKQEASMTDDDVEDDPEVQEARQQIQPYFMKIHDSFPELGRVPNLPTAFRGYLEAAKERARLRSLEKTDRLKVDLLKTVNDGLDQVARYEETVERILRNRDRRGTRDLEDKVAKRQLEIQLKQLDVQEAQLNAQLAGASERPRSRRESEDFAREIFEKQRSLSEVDVAVKKLVAEHPEQEEDIRAMAEHYRQQILTKGR